MGSLSLSFKYEDIFHVVLPDAYERLLLDCMLGDRTLFLSREGVEAAWNIVDPVLDFWRRSPEKAPLCTYSAGTWGPKESDELLLHSGHQWRNPPHAYNTHVQDLSQPLIVKS